jgi:hypothetical protein
MSAKEILMRLTSGENEDRHELEKSVDDIIVLNDSAPDLRHRKPALAICDLRILEAFQAVLNARQTENSIQMIREQVSGELDWE